MANITNRTLSQSLHDLRRTATPPMLGSPFEELAEEEEQDCDNNTLPPRSPTVEEDSLDDLRSFKVRPDNHRSITDPSLLNSYFVPRPSSSHRNRSPYSRSHLRSRSSGASLTPPIMTRAYSSPAVHSSLLRSFDFPSPSLGSLSPNSSPRRSPARQRSPLRPPEDFLAPRSPSWTDAIPAIQEDSELDLTPRATHHTASFSRSASLRRRPASPLAMPPSSSSPALSSTDTFTTTHNPNTSTTTNSSPSLQPTRFNESFPALHHFASSSSFSSVPSTPTSTRSRSPSISSLDTIEDAPDLEVLEAIEAERMFERLRLREDEEADGGSRRRGSFEAGNAMRVGFGFGRTGRERKRWSVCGGERRVDLDLDTIWED